eukprot:m.111581 g.111581  ORF g.111581 m.111581 type:complete len:222 (-) comp17007_c0_seq26:1550-2215(-)
MTRFLYGVGIIGWVGMCCKSDRVPTTMSAYIQSTSSSQVFTTSSKTPEVGDLRKLYSGLPKSCEVQIKTGASSVNPSDLYPTVAASSLPHVLGSDVAGEVVAAESSCQRLKVGDRVWGDIGANTKTLQGEKTKELGAMFYSLRVTSFVVVCEHLLLSFDACMHLWRLHNVVSPMICENCLFFWTVPTIALVCVSLHRRTGYRWSYQAVQTPCVFCINAVIN